MFKNIRTIIAFYGLVSRRRLFRVLLGGFLVCAPVALGLAFPLLVRDFVDSLSYAGRFDARALVLLGSLYLLSLALSYAGNLVYINNKFKAA